MTELKPVPKLDWGIVVQADDFSNVMRLSHLAMRRDSVDEDKIRTEFLLKMRRAYESELTVLAVRWGCKGRHGHLQNGALLAELNDIAEAHARIVVNTYNYDLAAQIKQIRQDVPRANRYTYRKRMLRWDRIRADLKAEVVVGVIESIARSQAQQDFAEHNGYHGRAEMHPKTAVCPVCIGWIARGKIKVKEALNHPPPYHMRCPHYWSITQADKLDKEECALLWMGE